MPAYGFVTENPWMQQHPANPAYWNIKDSVGYKLPNDLAEKEGVETVQTPPGFVSDLYSVPGIFRGLVRTDRIFMGPCLVHDWAYESHVVTRETADWLLLISLRDVGVGFFKRRTIYHAVKLGGAKAYATGPGRTGGRLALL